MTKLIGPFTQLITLDRLPAGGPVKDDVLEIISNAGILVENKKIIETGKFDDLRKSEKAVEVEEIEGAKTVLPGFIDAHTHICYAGSRSSEYSLRISGETYENILASGGGIYNTVSKTRSASDVKLKSLLAERAMRHFSEGVTTIEVKSGYGLDSQNELKILRAINECNREIPVDLLSTCLAAHVLPRDFDDESEYLDYLIKDLLPLVKSEKLSSRVDIFIERNAFSPKAAEDYLVKARDLGYDLTIHADQFNVAGSALAAKLKAMSADHLEASGDREINLLAKSGVAAVVLPGSSMGLGVPYAHARKMLDAGCRLVIASDWNPGSAPMGDLLMQASVFSAYEKLTTAETLSAITCRAAGALGIGEAGVISKNKKADFIAFDCADFREILYHQGKLKPSLIWKNGKKFELK